VSERLHNVLAAERERLGWTQSRMAEAAGISRQSYAAIETGGSVPSTGVALRLGAALGRPVEELFRLPDASGERRDAVWSGVSSPRPGERARLTRIGGRWIAHPCADAHRPGEPADGVVEGPGEQATVVRLFAERPPPAELAAVGCDPAFGIVVDELQRHHGIGTSWSQRGSRAALLALSRGEAHVAGVHLHDPFSDTWNARWVEELAPFPCTRISFAVWEQGLLVHPDAPRRVGAITDLGAKGVRLLNREAGSGSRALLDSALTAAGIEPAAVHGYETAARGHFSVADGIAAGAADAGVAIRAASASRGLGFLRLREEAYELVVPNHFLDLPAVEALLGVLRRPGVQRQVEALGGYDVATMGSAAT
jgi:putative molybdopterin biosynthesis protein